MEYRTCGPFARTPGPIGYGQMVHVEARYRVHDVARKSTVTHGTNKFLLTPFPQHRYIISIAAEANTAPELQNAKAMTNIMLQCHYYVPVLTKSQLIIIGESGLSKSTEVRTDAEIGRCWAREVIIHQLTYLKIRKSTY